MLRAADCFLEKSALVAALTTGAIATINSMVWLLAGSLSSWRLFVATIASVVLVVTWLVIDGELWDRPDESSPEALERSLLYNIATLVTLTIGVTVLQLALFVSILFAASITLTPDLFARTLGHPVSIADYLSLGWLVASIATVGGALGSGLEDDDGVRAAAYGIRQRQRFDE